MTQFRVRRRDRFTTIDRTTVNDSRLSFKARGLLIWLLDKPDDWRCDSTQIAQAGTEGREAVRSALNELEAMGYLHRRKYRNAQGQWVSETDVYETPGSHQDGFSGVGFPTSGSPADGFPAAGRSGALTKTVNEDCDREDLAPTAQELAERDAHPSRAADPIYDAIVEACGMVYAEMTPQARKACGVATADIRRVLLAVGVTDAARQVAEVDARAREYRRRFTDAALTPHALAKHWGALKLLQPRQPVLSKSNQALVEAARQRGLAQ